MKQFNSVKQIRQAQFNEVKEIIGEAKAKTLFDYFNDKGDA